MAGNPDSGLSLTFCRCLLQSLVSSGGRGCSRKIKRPGAFPSCARRRAARPGPAPGRAVQYYNVATRRSRTQDGSGFAAIYPDSMPLGSRSLTRQLEAEMPCRLAWHPNSDVGSQSPGSPPEGFPPGHCLPHRYEFSGAALPHCPSDSRSLLVFHACRPGLCGGTRPARPSQTFSPPAVGRLMWSG